MLSSFKLAEWWKVTRFLSLFLHELRFTSFHQFSSYYVFFKGKHECFGRRNKLKFPAHANQVNCKQIENDNIVWLCRYKKKFNCVISTYFNIVFVRMCSFAVITKCKGNEIKFKSKKKHKSTHIHKTYKCLAFVQTINNIPINRWS